MTKLEKVITGIEACLQETSEGCKDCPYHVFYPHSCIIERNREALELLKEQEKNVYTWICPGCDSQIILKAYKANKTIGMSFDCCPVCGKKVLYGKAD